jgi:hypothetical protein
MRGVRQEGFWTGVREVSSQDVQWVTENKELDLVEGLAPSRVENQELGIVEGSAPSKTEEKPTSSVSVRRAGYVGAPDTPGVIMAHHGKEKKEENLWMMVRTLTNWYIIRESSGMSWP